MDIDEYLSDLQSELDNQLESLGLGGQQSTGNLFGQNETNNNEGEQDDFQFCPECGTKVAADVNFCPNCGCRLVEEDASCDEDDDFCSNSVGIIFTDTGILAKKYGITIDYVEEVLSDFMLSTKQYNHEWHLLDMHYHQDATGKATWMECNEVLQQYIEDNDIKPGIKLSLFIIGGNDVIPIPLVEDVYGSSDTGRIPCDMCYCFMGNFFSDLWEYGDHTITEADVRNNVSRLPLEDGTLESTIEDDLQAYFNICTLYYESGIPANNVVMTANASWLPASKTMSEHLPLIVDKNADEDIIEDNMYVCPPVSSDDEDTLIPLTRSLKASGMLLFNLHGTDSEDLSGFYGDKKEEAFSIDMLSNTDARVLNTVACYGARYSGYRREVSMLLSAIYNNGFILYAGSLIPVPMCELDVPEGIDVPEGSGSEHLMPIYCLEQYRGVPAGEAMMRAKLEYFNTFRHLERDDFSLATIMMFSVYGNPVMRVQRNNNVLKLAEQCHVIPRLPQAKALCPICMKRTTRVLTKEELHSGKSLLEQVRGLVDANLAAIHTVIEKNLYSALGLEPRWLDHVDKYTIPRRDGSMEEGYIYSYNDLNKSFGGITIVEVDLNGNITRKTTTK